MRGIIEGRRGQANSGSAESIERFDRLGVKLLDASGKLRSVSDVLPEVTRALLAIDSELSETRWLRKCWAAPVRKP